MASASRSHVVHMTEAQSDQMRHTIQTRARTCQERRGQIRDPRDRRDAMSQATQASLLADMAGEIDTGMSVATGKDTMVALAVGSAYPPSTTPLGELQPISLAELRLDTHHRGRSLAVRSAAPVVPLVAYSWTMVEDEAKDIERLEVYLHKAKRGEDLLESASAFKIREPYFTINEQGEATIRIHHPSDLVRIWTDDQPKQAADAAASAQKCKDLGNAALAKADLISAHRNYTNGLQVLRGNGQMTEGICYDLLRNRAHVNQKLCRFDDAKTDAQASITRIADDKHKAFDAKANFRAGVAAYSLGQYSEARQYFQETVRIAPDDKDAAIYLRNIERRLSEERNGSYDFAKIKSKISRFRPRVDAANYRGKVVVRDSSLGGRGLFATHDLPAGALILCEKAHCVVWSHEREAWTAMTLDSRDDKIRVFPAGLSQAIVQKLLNNPSKVSEVMDLYGDYKSVGNQLLESEDGPIVDTFQIHDIVARNAFGPGPISAGGNYGDEDVRTASTGLWLLAAYINHSCVANAKKEYIGDLMVVRTTRVITAGEEITHSYDENRDLDTRRATLLTTWGFNCTCALCIAEDTDGAELRGKRRDLIAAADAFAEKEPPGNAKRLTISKAERMSRAIDDTYDDKRYTGLPRTALGSIRLWLEAAKRL